MLYKIFKKMSIAKIDVKSKNELQKQSSNKFIKNSLNNKSDLNYQINKFSYVKKTAYQKYLSNDRISNFVVESKIKFLIINTRNIFLIREFFENFIYFFSKTIFFFLLLDNFNIQLKNFETLRRFLNIETILLFWKSTRKHIHRFINSMSFFCFDDKLDITSKINNTSSQEIFINI